MEEPGFHESSGTCGPSMSNWLRLRGVDYSDDFLTYLEELWPQLATKMRIHDFKLISNCKSIHQYTSTTSSGGEEVRGFSGEIQTSLRILRGYDKCVFLLEVFWWMLVQFPSKFCKWVVQVPTSDYSIPVYRLKLKIVFRLGCRDAWKRFRIEFSAS